VVEKGLLSNVSRTRLIEQVFDQEIPQAILSPRYGTTYVAIVVDVSQYVSDREEALRQAIRDIVESFQKEGEKAQNVFLALVPFATNVEGVVPLTKAPEFPIAELDNLQARIGEEIKVVVVNGKQQVIARNLGHCNMAEALEYTASKIFQGKRDTYGTYLVDANDAPIMSYIVLVSAGLPYVTEQNSPTVKDKLNTLLRQQKQIKDIKKRCKGIDIRTRYIRSQDTAYKNTSIFDQVDITPEEAQTAGVEPPETFFKSFSTTYRQIEPKEMAQSIRSELSSMGGKYDALISEYSLMSETSVDPQTMRQESEPIKNDLLDSIQKTQKAKKNVVGMFLMENNKRIVMFDLFGSVQMFDIAKADLARYYANYAVERSHYPAAQYVSQPNRPSGKDIEKHLDLLLKGLTQAPKRVIKGSNAAYPYEFRQLAASKRIGFYFALGSEIFHIHMLSQKD
jgi:hypothetical protein